MHEEASVMLKYNLDFYVMCLKVIISKPLLTDYCISLRAAAGGNTKKPTCPGVIEF